MWALQRCVFLTVKRESIQKPSLYGCIHIVENEYQYFNSFDITIYTVHRFYVVEVLKLLLTLSSQHCNYLASQA